MRNCGDVQPQKSSSLVTETDTEINTKHSKHSSALINLVWITKWNSWERLQELGAKKKINKWGIFFFKNVDSLLEQQGGHLVFVCVV